MKNRPSIQGVDYACLLADLKNVLSIEKAWGQRALNQIKLQITWRIGERIAEEVKGQIEREKNLMPLYRYLAEDLGISVRYLSATVRFFRFYPLPQYLSPELTWSHYFQLIAIENEAIRRFYEMQAIENNWSVKELAERIRKKEHEKLEKSKVPLPLPLPSTPRVEDIVKNSYRFNFIQLSTSSSEKELEQALVNQIGKFILELGYGFCFMANQYKITIANKAHYVDLVFFHVDLACYVLIDLKVENFEDRFIGQMNKYLTYFRERVNWPYMRSPIGIIICKSWNAEEVHYALGSLAKEIFIAEYQLKLPTREELIDSLHISSSNGKTKVSVRQNRVLAEMMEENRKKFRIHEYKEKANVSLATAQRDLQMLVQADIRSWEKYPLHFKIGHQYVYSFGKKIVEVGWRKVYNKGSECEQSGKIKKPVLR